MFMDGWNGTVSAQPSQGGSIALQGGAMAILCTIGPSRHEKPRECKDSPMHSNSRGREETCVFKLETQFRLLWLRR